MKAPLSSKYAVIVVAALATVVAACGGGSPSPTPFATAAATATLQATATRVPATTPTVPPATPSPAATPTSSPVVRDFPEARRGGTLLRAQLTAGSTWDGWRSNETDAHDIIGPTYDNVLQYYPHDQTQIVPQLASGWKVSADALTYTITLRQGVKFHNGDPLTAEDVAWSYNFHIKPQQGYADSLAELFVSVDRATALDSNTVAVRLKVPDAAFVETMGFGRNYIFSKTFVEANGVERLSAWPPVVGSGPYMGLPDGYFKGVSVELVRSPNYFVQGRPFLDGMKFFIVPDVGTQMAIFLTGQTNFGLTPNVVQANELRAKLGTKVVIQQTPTLVSWQIWLDTISPPFSDIRLRKALHHAIDRHAVGVTVFQGLYKASGPITPGTGWGLPESELNKVLGYAGTREENIQAARKLLAEAGFSAGLKTTIWTRNRPEYSAVATVVRDNLRDVGIDANIQLAENAVYMQKWSDLTVWDIHLGAQRNRGIDPSSSFNRVYLPGTSTFAGFSAPELLRMYGEQNSETDVNKRHKLVNDLERFILESYATKVLFYTEGLYARYATVKNYQVHMTYQGNVQMRDVWMERA